ncbi:MAG: hypothetical protein EOO88_62625, partial [Pedobacter sp.]
MVTNSTGAVVWESKFGLSQVRNGLNVNTSPYIELGGTLLKPTVISASSGNTLAIEGLIQGDISIDKQVLIASSTGVLKTTAAENLAIEPWYQANTSEKATKNTDNIFTQGWVG